MDQPPKAIYICMAGGTEIERMRAVTEQKVAGKLAWLEVGLKC